MLPRLVACILADTFCPADDTQRQGGARPPASPLNRAMGKAAGSVKLIVP